MAAVGPSPRIVAPPPWPAPSRPRHARTYPWPVAGRPRIRTPVTNSPGRPRRTTRLTPFASRYALTPDPTRRTASPRRPATIAAPPATSGAPRAPDCITNQSGPCRRSGNRFTRRVATCSHVPTRRPRAVKSVTTNGSHTNPSRLAASGLMSSRLPSPAHAARERSAEEPASPAPAPRRSALRRRRLTTSAHAGRPARGHQERERDRAHLPVPARRARS